MDLAGGTPPLAWAVDDAGGFPSPRSQPHTEHEPPLHRLEQALRDDPLTGALTEKQQIRPVIADITGREPGPIQLDHLDTLLRTLGRDDSDLDLSGREWLEVTAALDRCAAFTDAATLTAIAELDRRRLEEKPARALRKDTRRIAADELAPVLRISPGAASFTVGLARQALDMPQATHALTVGVMTPAQFRVLAAVLKRLPDAAARAQVEAVAVRAAQTTVRSRLAELVAEAAVHADPAYAARATAQGIGERDVRLVASPVPGCQRVVADLELLDAAGLWQVLQQVALAAKDSPVGVDEHGQEIPEERSLPQLRADALVSTMVGLFSPTAATTAADAVADGADCDADAAEVPADTRAAVHIPTPEERAHLAEVHVVVHVDDITDPDHPEDPVDPVDPDDPDAPQDPADPDEPADSNADADSGAGAAEGVAVAAAGAGRGRTGGRQRAGALGGWGPFGYLPGLGRLSPVTTRQVLARAGWRRLVADAETGVLLVRSRWKIIPGAAALGGPAERRGELRERVVRLLALPEESPPGPQVTYRPGTLLAAHVRARDATCVGPACHHAARSGGIQLDHTRAWGPDTATRLRGGVTEAGNLGCVCQRVHTAKTHGGWLLRQPRPGRFVWTSPLGRVWHRNATPLLPDLLGDLAA